MKFITIAQKLLSKAMFLSLPIIIAAGTASAQCRVNSLIINTAYDHNTNTTVAVGSNDPEWEVTALSTDLQALAPSTPVYNAFVVNTNGTWATNPNSAWIAVLNSNTFATNAANWYEATFTRTFTTCIDDQIRFDIQIANDNYCPEIRVDGIPVPPGTPFTQPSGHTPAHYNSWTTIIPFIMNLTAGVHTIEVDVVNHAVTIGNNPMGLNIVGTVSSSTNSASIVSDADVCREYDCRRCDANFSWSSNTTSPWDITLSAMYPVANATYEWYVNGSLVGSGSPFTYSFPGPGYYEVCLYVINEAGEVCAKRCFKICVPEYQEGTPQHKSGKTTDRSSSFRVYPNPAGASFNVELKKQQEGNVDVRVYDASGKLVAQEFRKLPEGMQLISVNTAHLVRGVYLVKVTDGSKEYKETLVKQ